MAEVNLLNVPYVSQLGIGADKHKSDCGVASARMIIGAYTGKVLTVDDLYDLANGNGDGYLSVTQLQKVLNYYNISTEWRSNMSKLDLINILINSKPCIVLFNYGTFRSRIGKSFDTHFNGAHFATMIGIDTKYFYISDPLWQGQDGYAIPIKHEDWMYTWKSAVQDDNPGCAAIIPTKSIGGVDIVEPLPNALYAFKVIEPLGLTKRTSPKRTKSNATGEYLICNNDVHYCYAEKYDGVIMWGAINDTKTLWVALKNGNVDYIEKL
jgi:uncharacterized protein YvpB